MTIEQAKFVKMLVVDFECSYRQVHRMWQKVWIEESDWYISESLTNMLPKLKETMTEDMYDKYVFINTPSGNILEGRDLVSESEEILNEEFDEA